MWEYNAKKAAGPEEAAQAVRDVLARLDRESAPAPAVKEFPPTPQQQAIREAFLDGQNIAVQALAGTGKTTTLVLLARALLERVPAGPDRLHGVQRLDRQGREARPVRPQRHREHHAQPRPAGAAANRLRRQDRARGQGRPVARAVGRSARHPRGHRRRHPGRRRPRRRRRGRAPGHRDRQEVPRERRRRTRPASTCPTWPAPPGAPSARPSCPTPAQAWADISDTGNAKALAAGRALRVEHDDYLKVWALSRPVINAEVIFFDEAQDVNDVMRAVVLDPAGADRRRRRLPPVHLRVPGRDRRAEGLARRHRPAAHPVVAVRPGRRRVRQPVPAVPRLEAAAGGQPRAGAPGWAAPPNRTPSCAGPTPPPSPRCSPGWSRASAPPWPAAGDAIKEIAKAARDLQAGRGTKHPDLSRFADWDEVRDYARNDEDGKSLQVFVRLVDQHGPGGLIDMIDRLTPEGDTTPRS